MKYINPEIKINMFELESVVTEASAVVPGGNGVVSGLEGVDAANIRQINMSELLEVTKFTF